MRARVRRKRRRLCLLFLLAAVLAAGGLYLLRFCPRPAPAEPDELPSAAPEVSAPPETKAPESSEPVKHSHQWQPEYKVVHHEGKGHYETVVVQEAYDEPQYGTGYVCSACGAGFGDAGTASAHIGSAHGYEGSYYQATVLLDTVHHDAVTEQHWVVDEKTYDEQKLIWYICTCGERKAADSDEKPEESPPTEEKCAPGAAARYPA